MIEVYDFRILLQLGDFLDIAKKSVSEHTLEQSDNEYIYLNSQI